MMIRQKIFLVILLFCSISIIGQTTKTIEELNNELKIATENNDFQKAEQLKKEIQQVEEKNATIKQLEEDKKIAIFLEKYDEVIVIDKKIDDVKNGRNITPLTQQTNVLGLTGTAISNQPLPPGFENALLGAKQPKTKSSSRSLSEYEYNDKIIGSVGLGFRTIEDEYQSSYYDNYLNRYVDESYMEEYSFFSIQTSNHRWWASKYIAGGTFFDFIVGDYLSINTGAQIAFLADFDAVLLPYTSFGLGFGLNDDEEFYLPLNYKLGSYLFFTKERSIGAFLEFNTYFNNEYTPRFRFGLAWSRVKRKAKK